MRYRHRSRFTRAFEDQAAWLAVNTSKSAVAELMRVAWRTVGGICERVADEAQRQTDLLDGLRRIGIDEISHRKGQRYLTVVVDHDTGRLVWAAAGRDRKTVEAFFDALGQTRCKQIELVSCDMAGWIAAPVADRVPDAVRCVDPFHVVMLATDALDEVRREVWNEARRTQSATAAHDITPVGDRQPARGDPVAAAVAGADEPAAVDTIRPGAGVDDRGERRGDEVVCAQADPVRPAGAVDLVGAPAAAQDVGELRAAEVLDIGPDAIALARRAVVGAAVEARAHTAAA